MVVHTTVRELRNNYLITTTIPKNFFDSVISHMGIDDNHKVDIYENVISFNLIKDMWLRFGYTKNKYSLILSTYQDNCVTFESVYNLNGDIEHYEFNDGDSENNNILIDNFGERLEEKVGPNVVMLMHFLDFHDLKFISENYLNNKFKFILDISNLLINK